MFKFYHILLLICIRPLLFCIRSEATSVVCVLCETAYNLLKYALCCNYALPLT